MFIQRGDRFSGTKPNITFLQNFTDDAVMQINSKSKQDVAFVSKIYNKVLQQDDIVLMYNRVPKTGSTSFVGVVYDLCKKNKFHTLHINVTNNMHTLMLANQVCRTTS